MKKLIVLLVIIACTPLKVYSQNICDFGVNYSLSWSSLSEDLSPIQPTKKNKFSPINFGLFLDIQPHASKNPYFSLSTGLDYRQKRFQKDLKLNCLEIPLTINYRIPCIPQKLSVYLSAGGYVAYNTNKKFNIALGEDNYEETVPLNLNKIDSGVKFSISLGSPFMKSGLAIEYEHGLTNMLKKGQSDVKLKNRTWYLTLKIAGLPGILL